MNILTNTGIPIWTLVKVAILFSLFLYAIFGLVLVRQTNLMTETLELGHERIIKAFSVTHFILIIIIFILALIIL